MHIPDSAASCSKSSGLLAYPAFVEPRPARSAGAASVLPKGRASPARRLAQRLNGIVFTPLKGGPFQKLHRKSVSALLFGARRGRPERTAPPHPRRDHERRTPRPMDAPGPAPEPGRCSAPPVVTAKRVSSPARGRHSRMGLMVTRQSYGGAAFGVADGLPRPRGPPPSPQAALSPPLRRSRRYPQPVRPASGAVSLNASLPKLGRLTPMALAIEISTLVGLVAGSCR